MARKKKSYRRSRGIKSMLGGPMVKAALIGLGVGAAVGIAQQKGINIPIDAKIAAAAGGYFLGGPVAAIAGYFGTAGGQMVTSGNGLTF